MKRNLTLILLLASYSFTFSASADILHEKTVSAKAVYDASHEQLLTAQTRTKAVRVPLVALEKPIKDWGKITKLAADAKQAPWCDLACVESYNSLKKDVDAKIASKAPQLIVTADPTVLSALNVAVDAAYKDKPATETDIASFVARVAKKTNLNTSQKALLVVACYRAPAAATVEDCGKNVEALAKGSAAAANAVAIATPAAPLEITPEAFCWREAACLATYQSLIAKDETFDVAHLPSAEVCKFAFEIVANAAAVDLRSVMDLPTKAKFGGVSAEAQKALVLAVCPATLTAPYRDVCAARLKVLQDYSRAEDKRLRDAVVAAEDEEKKNAVLDNRNFEAYERAKRVEGIAGDVPARHIADRIAGVRRARCATAYCWGGKDGRQNAIEPVLDLPIGMYWSAGGGSLARFVNANNIKISASAGLRYWFAYDVMSVGILLAQPELTDTQTTVDFRDKSLSSSQVRRPYPTLIVGLWGDIIQLSASYDELRNAARTSDNYIQDYPANGVLSRAVTFGVALNPVTAARNGIGASLGSTEEAK